MAHVTIHSWTSADMSTEVAVQYDREDNDYGALLFVDGREIMNNWFNTEAEAVEQAKSWRASVKASQDE